VATIFKSWFQLFLFFFSNSPKMTIATIPKVFVGLWKNAQRFENCQSISHATISTFWLCKLSHVGALLLPFKDLHLVRVGIWQLLPTPPNQFNHFNGLRANYHYFRGMYPIGLDLVKKNQKITTCNWLDLKTLGF
jgi:hypothetical protein